MAATLIGLLCLGIAGTHLVLPEGEFTARQIATIAALAVAGLQLMLLGLNAKERRAVERGAGDERPDPRPPTVVERPAVRSEGAEAEVVSFLGLLQQKGRFIDFVMDDITPYPDAQVGAAARIVHEGCAQVIREYFDLLPVQQQSEGSAVTLEENYDPRRYRLVGKVVGRPPFRGTLVHPGWKAAKVKLPKLVPEATRTDIIAPAEVELN